MFATSIIIIGGFFFSWWLLTSGLVGLYRMIDSKKWLQTVGRIKDAEIKFAQFGDEYEGDIRFRFVLQKIYTYSINGKEYEGNQTAASDSLYMQDYKSIDKFPKKHGDYLLNAEFIKVNNSINYLIGRNIPVYYNPSNPKKACLDTSFNKDIFMPIFMGALFAPALTYVIYYVISGYLNF